MSGMTDTLTTALLDAEAAQELDVRGAVRAAVLVPLHAGADGLLRVVFTQRRNDLRRHPGEISFPGGRHDPTDADLIATALREAHEEIGLAPDSVRMLGALQPTPTMVTGFAVYPFVAEITPPTVWTRNETEVDEVLEFSLADVAAGYGRRRVMRRGVAMRTDTYLVEGRIIWGATARILDDLLDRLAFVTR